MTTHVVQFSGGIGSWAAAQRVAATAGTENLVLLFADTRIEDPDLYRCLADAARQLQTRVTTVRDGRTPFEVFRIQRFLGNSRIAPCTTLLKQAPARRWLEANADPADTVLYVGYRLVRDPQSARDRARLGAVGDPLPDVRRPAPDQRSDARVGSVAGRHAAPPVRTWIHAQQLWGACVRAGQRQWRHLLDVFPGRYLEVEDQERQLRAELGDVAILRDRSGGRSRPLTLSELRGRAAAAGQQPTNPPDQGTGNRSDAA